VRGRLSRRRAESLKAAGNAGWLTYWLT